MSKPQKATEQEIKAAYQGRETAEAYVRQRFVNEAQILLHRMQVAVVSDVIRSTNPQSVLEVAPGPGRITRDIHIAARRVCLEYNEGMLEAGREASDPEIRWVQGDAFAMPSDGDFADPFDLAYTFRFIRHFRIDDRLRLYAELRRVLRPGGHLVFDAVNAVVSRPLREAAGDGYAIYDELYERIEQLASEVQGAGFTLEKAIPMQRGFPLMMRSQNLLGPRINWLNRLFISALQNATWMAPLEWTVVCRRV